MENREQKTGRFGKAASISRTALETGAEFGIVASILQGRDELPVESHILSCEAFETEAPLDASPAAWLAEAMHYHVELGQRARARPQDGRGSSMTSLVALQRKLIGAVQKSGDTTGLEAASLAISFEEAAGALASEPGQSRFCRRLMDLVANTTDRCVLSERYRGFNGLVSEAATKACRSFPDAAFDLKRLGLLGKNDPRLAVSHQELQKFDRLGSEGYLNHVKQTLWPRLPGLRDTENETFSRRLVVQDLAALPSRLPQPVGQADLDRRDRDFMRVVGRVAERAAMNHHQASNQSAVDRANVASLLSTAGSATSRANGYEQRLRRQEREMGQKPRLHTEQVILN